MNPAPSNLVFGIHPFGVAGMPGGVATGPPDDYPRLPQIVADLRGGREFLLRTYVGYSGPESSAGVMSQIEFCARSSIPWDVVLCFRYGGADLDGWLRLIRDIVDRYGSTINSLQITNEPNLRHVPDAGDGSQPHVRQALATGVIAAKEAVCRRGATLSIGFNAVPSFQPVDDFWPSVKKLGDAFAQALDYVGIDFYPDVFGSPIALPDIPAAVEHILGAFRTASLAAGIPSTVPLRITENGWPTGPGRSYDRQAQVLETVIRTVHRLRGQLHITHYELFGLRDADSSNENSFYQFGIMRDDYTPKSAFGVYQRLIQELGR